MSIFQPMRRVTRSFGGEFDFPRGVIRLPGIPPRILDPCAPDEVRNIPPGDDAKTWLERWYDTDNNGFGTPPLRQGWATMYEDGTPPEEEDPDASPHVDLTLDRDRGIVINHTGRISGRMVELVLNGTFECRIMVTAHPLRGAVRVDPLHDTGWVTVEANSTHVANQWYLLTPSNLVYTLRVVIPPSATHPNDDVDDPRYPFVVPGVYRLIIDWDFRHKVAGTPDYHYEVLGGFDHNLVFRVGYKTSE